MPRDSDPTLSEFIEALTLGEDSADQIVQWIDDLLTQLAGWRENLILFGNARAELAKVLAQRDAVRARFVAAIRRRDPASSALHANARQLSAQARQVERELLARDHIGRVVERLRDALPPPPLTSADLRELVHRMLHSAADRLRSDRRVGVLAEKTRLLTGTVIDVGDVESVAGEIIEDFRRVFGRNWPDLANRIAHEHDAVVAALEELADAHPGRPRKGSARVPIGAFDALVARLGVKASRETLKSARRRRKRRGAAK